MYPSIVAALLADDDTPIANRRVAGKGLTVGEYSTTSTIAHAEAHPEDAPALAVATALLAGQLLRGAERWRRASSELSRMAGVTTSGPTSFAERAQQSAANLLGHGPDRRLPGLEIEHPASMAACMAADAEAAGGRERATMLWNAARLLIEAWRSRQVAPGAHHDAWIHLRDEARALGFTVPTGWSYASHPFLNVNDLEWTP